MLTTVVIYYILGICITGIFYTSLCNFSDGFYNHKKKEVKELLKNEADLIKNMINEDFVIKMEIIIISLFSYIGLAMVLIYFLNYKINK